MATVRGSQENRHSSFCDRICSFCRISLLKRRSLLQWTTTAVDPVRWIAIDRDRVGAQFGEVRHVLWGFEETNGHQEPEGQQTWHQIPQILVL